MVKWISMLALLCCTGLQARSINAEVLSLDPFVCCFYDFLSDEECDHLMSLAEPRLEPSKVLEPPKEGEERQEYSRIRTSSGAWLTWQEDAVVTHIENRIASVTGFPPENGENLHVLHYVYGQEYKPHYDWFMDEQPTMGRGGQRAVSAILYLAEPEEGGQTDFTKLDISVQPKKRMMLVFHNTKPNGERDYNTMHAGVPVAKGEKWIATKWIRYGDFQHALMEE